MTNNCNDCKGFDPKPNTIVENEITGEVYCSECGEIYDDSRIKKIQIEMQMMRDQPEPPEMFEVKIFDLLKKVVDEIVARDNNGH